MDRKLVSRDGNVLASAIIRRSYRLFRLSNAQGCTVLLKHGTRGPSRSPQPTAKLSAAYAWPQNREGRDRPPSESGCENISDALRSDLHGPYMPRTRKLTQNLEGPAHAPCAYLEPRHALISKKNTLPKSSFECSGFENLWRCVDFLVNRLLCLI